MAASVDPDWLATHPAVAGTYQPMESHSGVRARGFGTPLVCVRCSGSGVSFPRGGSGATARAQGRPAGEQRSTKPTPALTARASGTCPIQLRGARPRSSQSLWSTQPTLHAGRAPRREVQRWMCGTRRLPLPALPPSLQVRSLALELARLDSQGQLGPLFRGPFAGEASRGGGASPRTVVAEDRDLVLDSGLRQRLRELVVEHEGWILGCPVVPEELRKACADLPSLHHHGRTVKSTD